MGSVAPSLPSCICDFLEGEFFFVHSRDLSAISQSQRGEKRRGEGGEVQDDTKGNIIPQRIHTVSSHEWRIEKHNIGGLDYFSSLITEVFVRRLAALCENGRGRLQC